jgi:hypothetical protein
MAAGQKFAFNDSATFDENIAAFSVELTTLDAACGTILSATLSTLANEAQNRSQLLDDLFAGVVASEAVPAGSAAGPQPVAAAAAPLPTAVHWFLEGIEIEGFRGINNEGQPLVLKFNPDAVSSISAPNGVGKSSIYDALSFAIKGGIPKLDRLLQAERPQDYYLNKFNGAGVGTVKLTLRPDNGGKSVAISVTRTAGGVRSVSGPAGFDAEGLLAALDREFVLLDAQTFHSFIDDKALDRGRAFSGLLGLARYSTLRQQLQALCNTRAFNTHFETTAHAAKKGAADRNAATARRAIAGDYQLLVKEPLEAGTATDASQKRCHSALHGTPVLTDHCTDRLFMDIDVEACLTAVKTAEGGAERERLSTIIRDEKKWSEANKPIPTAVDISLLAELAKKRDDALKTTAGDMLLELFQLSKEIISAEDWPSPTLCPTCSKDDGTSVLDRVYAQLAQYDAVETATAALGAEWVAKGWADLLELEKLTIVEGEAPRLRELAAAGGAGAISADQAKDVGAHITVLRERAAAHLSGLADERRKLEKELPPSLVAVTTAVEAARRLQTNWIALESAEGEAAAEALRAANVARLKSFLDGASSQFADAESAMAAARLKKVEPLCRQLFEHIMFSPVVPAFHKPAGGEELGIRLAEFWGLKDVSAQALLSESYRNGFAVSVYLAAASLYGGAPRFIILDDVTSSFDAGHQHHLVEVIRLQFARPVKPDGPQVVLLSHDTLLEKLFNKHAGSPDWSHQRLEGTARTAVLLQSGAVNKVRDATIDLLNAGRVDDAAPRIRQYLEYILQSVIDRCRIPVPLDLAFSEEKRLPGEFLKAIEDAVELHRKAGTLVLDAAQQKALGLHSATIIGNFLSHWATGQTQAFSAPALLGVMKAIEVFPDCFKYEPSPGAPKKFYASLSHR